MDKFAAAAIIPKLGGGCVVDVDDDDTTSCNPCCCKFCCRAWKTPAANASGMDKYAPGFDNKAAGGKSGDAAAAAAKAGFVISPIKCAGSGLLALVLLLGVGSCGLRAAVNPPTTAVVDVGCDMPCCCGLLFDNVGTTPPSPTSVLITCACACACACD